MPQQTPQTLLLILDGWGQAPASNGNAVSLAKTPTLNALTTSPNKSLLACSGRAVGLPAGYMGNSEVGHMNIGAGRVAYQDMTRIDMSIDDGSFAHNETFCALLETSQKNNTTVHLMGLLSNGGVHSHINHLIALVKLAHTYGVSTKIHVFTDGRDTDPHSGLAFIKELQDNLPPSSRIVSISGRYYAMDRDKRWERTIRAWDAISKGDSPAGDTPVIADAISYVEASYAEKVTDEFIVPAALKGYSGILPGDCVFMFNFRADRMRQIARFFADETIEGVHYTSCPALSAIASMTHYEDSLPFPVAFAPQQLRNGLGEVVASAGLTQLRIAETEKYAHVTFFFNGGKEAPEPNEKRILIPSPRDVATYDLKPQMSAVEVTDALIDEWKTGNTTFFVCNLANMDMVGHTGDIQATVEAAETVDACVARILEAVRQSQGVLLLTADHGNAEEMLTPEHTPHTAHSTNPVALIIEDFRPHAKPFSVVDGGKLCDIAPTILTLWGLPQPAEMTGKPLVIIHE